MPAAIPDKIIRKIATTIREWPADTPFSWESVCKAAKNYLDYIPTRQCLSSKQILNFEFKAKKAELRNKLTPSQPKTMSEAVRQIENLRKEINSLEHQNQMLHEAMQRIIYNGHLNGLTKTILMKPLPKPSRASN
ncbi:TPA: hypothetical protein RQ837_003559 [Pseudomonas aeruginosa]|uniref:hypothetical protein n=1 Tax=Pseudomonas aeruginosa TaxID=287 RepID=UPI000F79B343|nr:hypothetical protein [Pseudomonas aeruginosa]MBR7822306.1 hypothetical protein [Pseudomonas aeruginosa]MBR7846577.1 hypothetical protein [Pseudomonas aeruginosa]MBR7859838.1 hypothetical protein [Pseudomonas aeruginosa]MBR7866529.1 hypothetical protein [Pseudomonas aeruginosa]MBW6202614.1 hypothetical protein [Pseudomonas aeruginosa]